MTTRYRMVGWLGLLGLLELSQPLLGQNVPVAATATAAAPDEQQKGQLWTATAQRVWADSHQKTPAPPAWKTASEFESWINNNPGPAGKSELGLLRGAVIARIGKGQTGTAPQVAQAILAEITQRRQQKTGALGRVSPETLRADLGKIVPLTAAAAAPATPDSMGQPATAAATTSAGTKPDASQSVVDENPAPDTPAALSPEPNYPPAAVTVSNATYFGLSPYAAMAVIGLLGAGLGALLFAQFGPRRSSRHSYRPPAPTPTSDIPVKDTPEYKKLRQAYDKLQREVNELKRQIAELRGQSAPMAPPPTEPEPEADALFQVTPHDVAPYEATPPVAPPAERPAAAPAALTLYGPVQETPFLEERKIVDSPLPQLALMLTIDPRRPEQASFTLNPQVNQIMLIGDGLNRLQKFFDYDMPMGRISSVTAAAPGKLQRQADGWQVVERARLTIR